MFFFTLHSKFPSALQSHHTGEVNAAKHTLSVCSGFAFGFAPAFADRCLIGLGWVFDRHSIYIRYKFDQMFNLCWNLACKFQFLLDLRCVFDFRWIIPGLEIDGLVGNR